MTFIHSFLCELLHSFDKFLLSTCYMLDTSPGLGARLQSSRSEFLPRGLKTHNSDFTTCLGNRALQSFQFSPWKKFRKLRVDGHNGDP